MGARADPVPKDAVRGRQQRRDRVLGRGERRTYTLLAIAAVALGGTSLWGGRGGLFGAVLGAASIYLLQNLLTTLGVNPSWLQVVYGGMLVLAVVLVGAGTRAKEPA